MTTNLAPVLLIAWAIVALVTLMLYAYRGRLTRDEEGQIFLDDAFAHEKAIQTEIVTKVNRLQPMLRASLILTILMTVAVVGYYSWGASKALFE